MKSPLPTLFLFMCLSDARLLIQPNGPGVSFFMLALQWPNSFCNALGMRQCHLLVRQIFTVHGCWGFDRHGNILPDCTAGVILGPNDEKGVVGLDEYWPSHVAGEPIYALRNRQWRKHGRCLGLTPKEYLENITDLIRRIDSLVGGSLIQFFIENGLPPDKQRRYDPRIFLSKIEMQTGLVAQMQCNVNKNGEHQLYEIRFCVSNNWDLINCPHHNSQNKYYKKPQAKNCPKKKGPNTQKSCRKLPPQLPSYNIGSCYGNDPILFPTEQGSPPPPRRSTPTPSPPPPPLKQKKLPPPPPPSPPILANKIKKSTYAEALLKSKIPPPSLSKPPPSPTRRRGRWHFVRLTLMLLLPATVLCFLIRLGGFGFPRFGFRRRNIRALSRERAHTYRYTDRNRHSFAEIIRLQDPISAATVSCSNLLSCGD